MIAPPVINDLRAIFELASQGVELDLQQARISPQSPLTEALASRLSFGGMGAETFVLYANGRKQRALGMVQARLRKNRTEADITFIAPALDADHDAVATWYRLLAEATNGLGELGCQRIFVQVSCGNGSEEVFRQAGFAAYAREDVYLLSEERSASYRQQGTEMTLRRQRKRDRWNLMRLYSALTPRTVQAAEGVGDADDAAGKFKDSWDSVNSTGYIIERGNALVGSVRITRGRLANWVRLAVHPEAQAYVDELVREAIALASKTRARPVYVSVRHYEGGIRAALEVAGFEWQFERCLMVKHTTVRIKETVPWLAPVLDTTRAPAIHTSHQARELSMISSLDGTNNN